MGYLVRVVFTSVLSESYVGISGLFTDILNVLSLSELGMETAITYALYEPIAHKNIEKQKSVMALYKKLYTAVAFFILAAGLLLIPFLQFIIRDPGDVTGVIPIYLLYLANTVVSYFFIYRKTLMDASQLRYVGVAWHTFFLMLQDVAQIVVLLVTRNFILFLVIYLLCTIGYNYFTSRAAIKRFPYLKDKEVEPLPEEEKKDIFKNIRAMLMHKIGNVVVNDTDNILLSAMTGLVNAGIYANNFLVFGSIRQLLNEIFLGITASVGNLSVTEDDKKAGEIFDCAFFVDHWLFGFASICLLELLSPFAVLSFGKTYGYALFPTVIIVLNFYVTGMRQATIVYRDACGLFYYDRYKAFAEGVINIVASVILTNIFGFVGVFMGTFVSTMLTSFWVEPFVLYKYKLRSGLSRYFAKYVIYTVISVAAALITFYLCEWAGGALGLDDSAAGLIFTLILRLFICVVVVNLVYLLCFFKTKEFKLIMEKAGFLRDRRRNAKISKNIGEELEEDETAVLGLIRRSIGEEKTKELNGETSTEDADDKAKSVYVNDRVLEIMRRHTVIPIVFDPASLKGEDATLSEIQRSTEKTALQSYHLLFETVRICEALEGEGILAAVLKGAAAASFFPVPEYRKSGDVDILLCDPEDIERAVSVMEKLGYQKSEVQDALHQVVFENGSGIEVELHIMLAEPFDNSKINEFNEMLLPDIAKHIKKREIMGYRIPVLDDDYQAYELLLHMLQHFLRRGFGLKLLCDWVCYWNDAFSGAQADTDKTKRYRELVKEAGLKGFSDIITVVCYYYLGLKEEAAIAVTDAGRKGMDSLRFTGKDAAAFLREIFDAGEFGNNDGNRMVMLRDRGLFSYIREFHHQMHLNYPRAGKVFIFWPVLWLLTLIRFLINNRKVRKVSTMDIMKKAGERSKLMERIKLWRE